MKRMLGVTLILGLGLVVIVACAQVTQTPTQTMPAVEETTEAPATETLVLSPTETATKVEETEPTTTTAPTEETPETTEAVDDVKALIVDRCSSCHPVDRVLNADKTEGEWDATIDRMVDYGAQINEEEKSLMIEWLISRDE